MIIKVEIEGKVYSVSIKDVHSNPVLAEVDGKVYQVFPEVQGPAVIPAVAAQPAPVPVAAPAAPAPTAGTGLTLNAPLPGVIVSIDVQAGQAVKTGQQVCMLEAMKMQNEIMAPCDGTVVEVRCNEGQAVNTGDVLVVLG